MIMRVSQGLGTASSIARGCRAPAPGTLPSVVLAVPMGDLPNAWALVGDSLCQIASRHEQGWATGPRSHLGHFEV